MPRVIYNAQGQMEPHTLQGGFIYLGAYYDKVSFKIGYTQYYLSTRMSAIKRCSRTGYKMLFSYSVGVHEYSEVICKVLEKVFRNYMANYGAKHANIDFYGGDHFVCHPTALLKLLDDDVLDKADGYLKKKEEAIILALAKNPRQSVEELFRIAMNQAMPE